MNSIQYLAIPGAVLLALFIAGCAQTTVEDPVPQLCEIRSFQPITPGSYWVYETKVLPSGSVFLDSIVVTDTTSSTNATSFTRQYHSNGALVHTFTCGFTRYGSPNEYLVEDIPGRYCDLRTPSTLRDLEFQGPVLYCGTELGPSSIYAPLDSVTVVDSKGNAVRVGQQYHIVNDGTHQTGVVSELTQDMPSPPIPGSTVYRRIDMTARDTVMIQEPWDATFTNGKRYYSSTSQLSRIYVLGVGMIYEMLSQEIYEPSSNTPAVKSSTRRLLRYGTLK